jgi:hypothetical protein
MQILFIFLVAIVMPTINAYMVPKMVFGDVLKKAGLLKEKEFSVEFTKGEQTFSTQAMKGDKLSDVAEKAGGKPTCIPIAYCIVYYQLWKWSISNVLSR